MKAIFAGVAFLYYERLGSSAVDEQSYPGFRARSSPSSEASPFPMAGEVALLDPSPAHTPKEILDRSGHHNPLVIVRRDDVAGVEGVDERFPLEGAINPDWLGEGSNPADFIGWSLRSSTGWFLGDETANIRPIQELGAPADPPADWTPVDFVPSLNTFHPGLRLAKEWRDSPHVTHRFLLGSGVVGSARPLQTNLESKRFIYANQTESDARPYSDAISYDTPTVARGIVLDRKGARSIIRLHKTAKQIWILNLDDPRRSDPTYDHFVLFGLLPWNFTVPKYSGVQPFTGGDCLGARYYRG